MIKKILLTIFILYELNTFRMWNACRDFSDKFHFSYPQMGLRLEDAVHNDIGFSPELVRLFHNKPVFFVNSIFSNYFHFWDIRFGVMFFSIVGYFGIFCGFWYLVRSKFKYKLMMLALLLMLPLVEIFGGSISYDARLILISFPYLVFSIYGIWGFMRDKKGKGVLIVLGFLILSIWYQYVFSGDIFFDCVKK
ncbi:MAG TPA: hypothetical protein VM077_01790 [Candidatus Limnocylindrales bacterium]|nr:hypothetical protein [Candidatus Limnocylindrales bacterium]